MDKIEIPISKKKTILSIIGALMFILVGIWFVIYPPHEFLTFSVSAALGQILGAIAILVFGIFSIGLFKILINKKVGLTIDSVGILWNAGGLSVGFVPWEDVVEIKEYKINGQPFINVIVTDPQKYLHRYKSYLSRRMAEMNIKLCGTPVNISATSLKCNFRELHKLLTFAFDEHKANR